MPSSVEKVYSDALFTLVRDENRDKLPEVLDELGKINGIIGSEPDFTRLMSTPTVPITDKYDIIEAAFSGKCSDYVYNFLRLLAENGRIGYFGKIYRRFLADYNELFGIAEITVTTAKPMTDRTREAVTKRAAEMTGKKITLREKLDPTLIGGIVMDIGTTRLDGSVKNRLSELRRELSAMEV